MPPARHRGARRFPAAGFMRMAFAFAALGLATGCVKRTASGGYRAELAAAPAAMRPAQGRSSALAGRMWIREAQLTIQVGNVSSAVAVAVSLVTSSGGYVEREWTSDHAHTLTLRVPAESLGTTVAGLEDLGDVTYRNVSSQDVTEEFVDTDARLRNLVALRERLRELLGKATEIKDLLAIETELGRIQGDIESMEARLQALKGQIDLSQIRITFERRRVLGPLGYVARGVYWTLRKLFILRD